MYKISHGTQFYETVRLDSYNQPCALPPCCSLSPTSYWHPTPNTPNLPTIIINNSSLLLQPSATVPCILQLGGGTAPYRGQGQPLVVSPPSCRHRCSSYLVESPLWVCRKPYHRTYNRHACVHSSSHSFRFLHPGLWMRRNSRAGESFDSKKDNMKGGGVGLGMLRLYELSRAYFLLMS